MEAYSPKKQEKKKKYNSRKEALGLATLGAAVAAVSYNPDRNHDELNEALSTSKQAQSKYEANFDGHETGINYDKDSNTVILGKETNSNFSKEKSKKDLARQEKTVEMSEKEKLDRAIEMNDPNRFFEFKKYENYSDEAKEFASWITDTYNKLSKDEDFSPKGIFTDDYYMAIALTESGGNGQAESHAGAVGAMQLKPVAVRDLSRVLGVLKRKGAEIDYHNESKVLEGEELAMEVLEMSKYDYPLNISMGKAYLNGTHATYPEFSEDRDLLTTSYNFGASRVKDVMEGNLEYNDEAAGYAPKVNLYEKNILLVKQSHPYLNNREVRDIVRDYGHHQGEITEEYVGSKLTSNKGLISL